MAIKEGYTVKRLSVEILFGVAAVIVIQPLSLLGVCQTLWVSSSLKFTLYFASITSIFF